MVQPSEGVVSGENLAERYAGGTIDYWLKFKCEVRVESIKCLEEAAKQIIMIASFLQGVYFAAISFSDIKKIGNLNDIWFLIFSGLSILIIGFWVACLYCATRVFAPQAYETGIEDHDDFSIQARKIQDTYDKVIVYKHKRLERAYWLLWLSFLPLAANLVIYLILLPAPPATP